ncbi:MAG: ATP-dependent dethiobiotin synthetase BioD [Cyanobacteria bacterium RM1_2_2]|nr:ATP-dependent dethiobiotin synthetase BioD [Cyanobacteria bacterium RM1_2_2]
MNTLLIAGTDTKVGKTVVIMALLAYWQRYCAAHPLGVMKPVECRRRDDATERDCEKFSRLFNLDQTLAEITPVSLGTAALPPIAVAQDNVQINLEDIWQRLQQLQLQKDLVLVEAWGGLGAPLTYETTVADLAWDWHLPTVLVVPVQPGSVSQAVANVALAQQARLHLKGIILNSSQPDSRQEREDWAPVDLIQSLTRKPVLGHLPFLEDLTDINKLAQIASEWQLERFLPQLEAALY